MSAAWWAARMEALDNWNVAGKALREARKNGRRICSVEEIKRLEDDAQMLWGKYVEGFCGKNNIAAAMDIDAVIAKEPK